MTLFLLWAARFNFIALSSSSRRSSGGICSSESSRSITCWWRKRNSERARCGVSQRCLSAGSGLGL
eukprot:CAMPEP_0174894610 /NCGR_PEP_ID=MMETSP0167-20121228/9213_1 /TAXON_ID=38298 /ORGANISM="Rhodella maculata, Strain CCMP736" /LENGTH=65 /DNA_ID=CAMNT_0016133741 /DNA_START=636 /DNA_END=833 /DNA_ORIENTATION=+